MFMMKKRTTISLWLALSLVLSAIPFPGNVNEVKAAEVVSEVDTAEVVEAMDETETAETENVEVVEEGVEMEGVETEECLSAAIATEEPTMTPAPSATPEATTTPVPGPTGEPITSGDYMYSSIDGTSCAIVDYVGTATELTIPSQIDGYLVREIAESAFANGTFTKVVCSEGITYIGDWAFYDCKSLESIVVPNSVKKLGGYKVFRNCINLKLVNSPLMNYDFRTIYPYATEINITGGEFIDIFGFSDMESLVKVTLPDTLTEIRYGAFEGCIGLEKIEIPDSVRTIEQNAFKGCTNLISVKMPSSWIDSGELWDDKYGPFYNCPKLVEIIIPYGTKVIPALGFYGISSLKEIAIPDTVEVIEELAFSGTGLKEVKLPSNLKQIKSGAFGNCKSLTSIDIPDTVTEISCGAFCNCTNLNSVKLSTAWEICEWNEEAYYEICGPFQNCYNLTEITIPKETKKIPTYAFKGCTGLTKITIHDAVQEIGKQAFADCTELAEVNIDGNLQTVGTDAFKNCNKLSKIVFSEGVEQIPDNAFANCTSLTSVIMPGTLKKIGSSAFYNCQALANIELPEGLEIIEEKAFENCTALSKIEIPNTVTDIASRAFANCKNVNLLKLSVAWVTCKELEAEEESYSPFVGCTGIKEVMIPEGMISIPNRAFYGCSFSRVVFPQSLVSIGEKAFAEATSLDKVVLNEALESVGEEAFKGCKSLSTIEIPRTTTFMGNSVFSNCTFLRIYCYKDSPAHILAKECSINYGLFYEDETTGVRYVYSILDDTNCAILKYMGDEKIIIMPSEIDGYVVKEMAADTFDWREFTEITLPKCLIAIAGSTFTNCNELERVILPDKLTKIGSSAFSGCERLIEISFPDSLVEIGTYAFRSCGLLEITLPEGLTDINYSAFAYCEKLKEINFSEGLLTIGGSAFSGCLALQELNFPLSLTQIDSYAFGSCTGLKEISFPEGIEQLGSSVFEGCVGVEKLILPQNYGTWSGGWGAFQNCSSLTEVIIPEGVTVLQGNLFAGCTSLKKVTLPKTLESIGSYTFDGCTSLEEITLPENLTEIQYYAFARCENLTTIRVPKTVTSMDYCFTNCPNLIISCYVDTAAHIYAVNYSIPYILIHDCTPDDKGYCTECGAIANGEYALYGRSLNLSDDIGVIYYMEFTDTVDKDQVSVTLTLDGSGKSVTIPLKNAIYRSLGDGRAVYGFRCAMFANEMNQDITAKLYFGDELKNSYNYSVATYCSNKKNDDTSAANDKLMDVINSVLVYGAMSQNYFKTSTNDLVTDKVEGIPELIPLSNSESASLSNYTREEKINIGGYFEKIGMALVLYSQTALRANLEYRGDYTLNDFTFEAYDVTNGNAPVAGRTGAYGGKDYFEIPNITPTELDHVYKIVIKHNGNVVREITYSPFAYINAKKSDTSYSGLSEVVVSMYRYCQAAKAYAFIVE